MSEREFTFQAFERLTPDLSPPQRLRVFLGIEADMQGEAWRVLTDRCAWRTRELLAEHRLGPFATTEEIVAEIAAIVAVEECWREIKGIPLGYPVQPEQPRPRGRATPSDQGTVHHPELETLRAIPSAEFVPTLTGRDPDRAGYIQCPLHGDGNERTPSLHVSDTEAAWHCFGCDTGGGIFEFYAALHDTHVPAGREFFTFADRLAGALKAGER
jgi:hypothetical protein